VRGVLVEPEVEVFELASENRQSVSSAVPRGSVLWTWTTLD